MSDVTEQFEMTVVHVGAETAVLIDLSGELDLYAAGIVGDRVDDLLGWGVHALHVDASKVTFVDSSGLHCLLDARRQCDGRGIGFRIVGVSRPLRDLVEMTGTAGMLPGV